MFFEVFRKFVYFAIVLGATTPFLANASIWEDFEDYSESGLQAQSDWDSFGSSATSWNVVEEDCAEGLLCVKTPATANSGGVYILDEDIPTTPALNTPQGSIAYWLTSATSSNDHYAGVMNSASSSPTVYGVAGGIDGTTLKLYCGGTTTNSTGSYDLTNAWYQFVVTWDATAGDNGTALLVVRDENLDEVASLFGTCGTGMASYPSFDAVALFRNSGVNQEFRFDLVTDESSAGQGALPNFDFDIPGLESGDGVYSIDIDSRTASSTNTIVDFSINYCRNTAVTLAWNWSEDDDLVGGDTRDISSEDADCDNTATSSIEVLSSAMITLCASTHQTGVGVAPPYCVEFPANLSIQIPEFQNRACSFSDLQGCLINAGLFLFRPNPDNISAVVQTAQSFETKFPFAYIAEMKTILQTSLGTEEEFELGVSATSTLLTINIPVLSTGDIETNPYLDWDFLYTLMRWSVYIWFGLFVYRVAVSFRMKNV